MSVLVFVTGASGYVGSHIVEQLLKAGYRVRAAARGQKAVALKNAYNDVPKFEVVEINDIAFDQFPEALKGVDAVIHAAAPIPGREDIKLMLENSIEGALNVLRQAEKVGIKRFVVTSSSVTVSDKETDGAWTTDKDWNSITREAAIASGSLFDGYTAAKKYAELAVWEWAEAHPHVEVTTINPTWCYGPFADRYPLKPGDFTSFSTNINLYQFIVANGTFPISPIFNDVRDVAKAHISALASPTSSEVGRKRVVFSAPHGFDFKDAVEIISRNRPQLKDRLIKNTTFPEFASDRFNIDFKRIETVVGLKKEEFYTFEQTLLDSVDSILKIEEEWKAQGYVVEEVPLFI